MLESLVDPSAVMALGYGFATLTLNSDEVVAGIVEAEDNKGITVKVSKTETRIVDKLQVKERINAVLACQAWQIGSRNGKFEIWWLILGL